MFLTSEYMLKNQRRAEIIDLEVIRIATTLKKHEVNQCVIGDLLLDEKIKEKMLSVSFYFSKSFNKPGQQSLDCTSGESYELNASSEVNSFSQIISSFGIKVFKKFSCVNSYILNRPNPLPIFSQIQKFFLLIVGLAS